MPLPNFSFAQVFGDKASLDKVFDQDIITDVKFDKTGNYLSLGDKSGRLILFQSDQVKNKCQYNYLTQVSIFHQLQSHVRQFDPLKSTEIFQKINCIEWISNQGNNMYVLTTNDKSIKLWKLAEKQTKKVVRPSGKDLNIPKLQVVETGIIPVLKLFCLTRTCYPQLHTYPINSISASNNQQYILSSDEFKIYIWDLNKSSQAYIAIDRNAFGNVNQEDIITSSVYHPISDTQIVYSTSTGMVFMNDLRISTSHQKNQTNFDYSSLTIKNFFTDLIATYSSVCFSQDGKYIIARDYLNVRVNKRNQIWDIAKPNQPVNTIFVHSALKSKLCDLYDGDFIFDKFKVDRGPENIIVTGSYNQCFSVINIAGVRQNYKENDLMEFTFKKKQSKVDPKAVIKKLDGKNKVLKCAYHPKQHVLAITCLNCLFFYST